MKTRYALDDRETQARSSLVPCSCGVGPVKTVEHSRQVLLWYSISSIGDCDKQFFRSVSCFNVDFAAAGCMRQGVLHHVGYGTLKQRAIELKPEIFGSSDRQMDPDLSSSGLIEVTNQLQFASDIQLLT